MNELIAKKEELCENIKELINKFLDENNLEFSSLSYDLNWDNPTPKIEKIKLRITV